MELQQWWTIVITIIQRSSVYFLRFSIQVTKWTWSRIFRFCIFNPGNLVPHLLFLHFQSTHPYVKTFSTLSTVKLEFWISSLWDILCISQVKCYYTTSSNSPLTLSPVYAGTEVRKVENFSASSSDLRLVNLLLGRALQQKLYRQEIEGVDHLKGILLHCLVWWA